MIPLLAWLAGTRTGRMAAIAGATVLGVLAVYGKGRRDAGKAGKRRRLADYRATRKRADAALRRAAADTRPADERLNEHGRLRDE